MNLSALLPGTDHAGHDGKIFAQSAIDPLSPLRMIDIKIQREDDLQNPLVLMDQTNVSLQQCVQPFDGIRRCRALSTGMGHQLLNHDLDRRIQGLILVLEMTVERGRNNTDGRGDPRHTDGPDAGGRSQLQRRQGDLLPTDFCFLFLRRHIFIHCECSFTS